VRDDVDDFVAQCVHEVLQAHAWARSTKCYPSSPRKRHCRSLSSSARSWRSGGTRASKMPWHSPCSSSTGRLLHRPGRHRHPHLRRHRGHAAPQGATERSRTHGLRGRLHRWPGYRPRLVHRWPGCRRLHPGHRRRPAPTGRGLRRHSSTSPTRTMKRSAGDTSADPSLG
jgi:hypothetical protein